MKVAELTRQMRQLEADLRQRTPDGETRMAQWEESVKNDQPDWEVVPITQISGGDTRFYTQKYGSAIGLDSGPTKFTFSFITTNRLPAVHAFRPDRLTSPNAPT